MKRFVICFVVLSFMRLFGEPVASSISEVTLFADRALVSRVAEFEGKLNVMEVELPPLPAWVNVASIRAKVTGGDVLDVRTRREFLSRTPDEDLRAAEEGVREVEDEIGMLQDHLRALDMKSQQIQQAKIFASEVLPAEVVRRDIPVETFKEMAEFVFQGVMEVNAERRKVSREIQELQPELTARRNRLNELRRGNRLEQLILSVSLKLEAAGPARLSVTYELPGATWETAHDVRIENEREVNIVSLAKVRQTSGEDWENVKLLFSTRRPGNAANIPELESLLLGGRHAVNSVAVNQQALSSWATSNSYYNDNMIQFNRAKKGKMAGDVQWEGNFREQMASQTRAVQVFEKLERRGTTALFEAEGRFTVRSDGNPVRIPYASVKEQGELSILAAPEISANAARGLELTYTHAQPLLPGDAALFVEGAYIGNTRLDFAGPGESFILFAGSEDRLKVTRRLNHDESDLRRGRRTNVMKVHYDITVENTGDVDLPLKLADRIPVSDDKAIDVDHIRIEPEVEPTEEGLLHWEVVIPANSTKTFTLRYVVDYPAGLRLQPRMNSQSEGGEAAQQIMNLERMF